MRLPDALALADGVLSGPVNRAQLLADEDRLSPEAIAESLRRRGPQRARLALRPRKLRTISPKAQSPATWC